MREFSPPAPPLATARVERPKSPEISSGLRNPEPLAARIRGKIDLESTISQHLRTDQDFAWDSSHFVIKWEIEQGTKWLHVRVMPLFTAADVIRHFLGGSIRSPAYVVATRFLGR